MQEREWKRLLVWGLGALVVLWLVSSLFSGWHHGGGWGMMGPGMAGEWHRGRMAPPSIEGGEFGPFGLVFGLVGMMFRFGVLALLLLGGAWLFYRMGGPQMLSSVSAQGSSSFIKTTCPNCGQAVESNWRHCPNCGQPLPQANNQGGGPEGPPPTETIQA
jgi:hypothetical protein